MASSKLTTGGGKRFVAYFPMQLRARLEAEAKARRVATASPVSMADVVREALMERFAETDETPRPPSGRRQFARIKPGGSGSRLTTSDGAPATTDAPVQAKAA